MISNCIPVFIFSFVDSLNSLTDNRQRSANNYKGFCLEIIYNKSNPHFVIEIELNIFDLLNKTTMRKFPALFLFLFFIQITPVFSQESTIYTYPLKDFDRAFSLYEDQQYAA